MYLSFAVLGIDYVTERKQEKERKRHDKIKQKRERDIRDLERGYCLRRSVESLQIKVVRHGGWHHGFCFPNLHGKDTVKRAIVSSDHETWCSICEAARNQPIDACPMSAPVQA